MLQIVIRFSIERPWIASPAYSTACPAMPLVPSLPDRRQDQILRGDTRARGARVADPHRPRSRLHQALGREHVLDLRGPDPEREGSEGAVRGGVAVPADDRQTRLREPQLGPDHVDDPLVLGTERVDRHAELGAISLQGLDLNPRELVRDQARRRRAVGGHVVVGGGDGPVRAAHAAALEPQPVERLRRGDLVDEVQVDVDQPVRDLVGVPDLVEHRACHIRRLNGGAARLRFAPPHIRRLNSGAARLRFAPPHCHPLRRPAATTARNSAAASP